ncbi:anti-sigma factor domain-containing protein [Neobacillus sp. C211]|uniref:anti-sigma factor n=1 Tax=unclassified Neobacillus TaxID=2675272 RepID=UPI00397AC8F0
MSINSSCSLSSELISYLIGELSEEERLRIERHLLSCSSCSKDMQEMQEAWTMLPYELDDVEVPTDLKDEVLNAIFTTENSQPTLKRKHLTKKSRRYLYGFAAASLIFSFGGVIWNNINLRDQVTELTEQAKLPPEVIQVYALKTANPTTDSAQGQALLYKQGDKKQLVFQLQGLTNTKGSEAYQVWLIEDGNRKSAGTFHVDEKGNGFLTYQLNEEISFEAIGISLEPDANGTKPRGKKVLET